jgi:hypothetical protein
VYVPRRSGSPHGVRGDSWAFAAAQTTTAVAPAVTQYALLIGHSRDSLLKTKG